ncbi:hypothetical protein BB427_13990 [Pseudoalteromonas sp. BMB]|uniref:flagellar basal body rod C-terminal domain-containing protein n=1 Tax=Pseudoalteromonas sp. BMB TaxID=1874619 RepID=UPI00083D71A0|nr:flagellar basal body rod C-terminal domain-containing protein [Pseudoalteromonas sp. BMB]ODB37103.1 hypothetical protein BB427_13990 [Pseudoalteromonas sp. BMB]
MSVIDAIALGIERDLQHLKAVSENVANVNTPGYQAVQSFDAVLNADQVITQQLVSKKFGAVKDSERNLDWAITSTGYFVIEKDQQLFITRYGRFHVSKDGLLTHVSGGKLLGESGPINVGNASVSVSTMGAVLLNGKESEQLKIVDVAHIAKGVSGGLYSFRGQVSDVMDIQVRKNAINTSNVDSGEQMTNMINLNRHIQSLQKAALAYDQMMSAGINELGKK